MQVVDTPDKDVRGACAINLVVILLMHMRFILKEGTQGTYLSESDIVIESNCARR